MNDEMKNVLSEQEDALKERTPEEAQAYLEQIQRTKFITDLNSAYDVYAGLSDAGKADCNEVFLKSAGGLTVTEKFNQVGLMLGMENVESRLAVANALDPKSPTYVDDLRATADFYEEMQTKFDALTPESKDMLVNDMDRFSDFMDRGRTYSAKEGSPFGFMMGNPFNDPVYQSSTYSLEDVENPLTEAQMNALMDDLYHEAHPDERDLAYDIRKGVRELPNRVQEFPERLVKGGEKVLGAAASFLAGDFGAQAEARFGHLFDRGANGVEQQGPDIGN